MNNDLPVSIYPVWQWWERHGLKNPPPMIDPDYIDRIYLARQRFMYDHFAEFSIGAAVPGPDKAFVGQVLPFHEHVVPIALGLKVELQEGGGYAGITMNEEAMKNLAPVDLADTALGELILKQRDERLARYGVAPQMIGLNSVSNNAFLMRGPDFYADLMVEQELACHYLGVIRETMRLAARFIGDHFGPLNQCALGNCNVTMMSPELYEEMILPYDIACVEDIAALSGQKPCCSLHHCDVKTEPFAQAYSRIPGLTYLQGSYRSDLIKIHEILPETGFSAMISPVELLTRKLDAIEPDLDLALAGGAVDLALWNIDASFSPENMAELLGLIRRLARNHDRNAVFNVIPITWEELDWEFPQYQL